MHNLHSRLHLGGSTLGDEKCQNKEWVAQAKEPNHQKQPADPKRTAGLCFLTLPKPLPCDP
jgi:hypothetical protein